MVVAATVHCVRDPRAAGVDGVVQAVLAFPHPIGREQHYVRKD